MAVGRIYQASLTASLDIAEPTGRIYQAVLHLTDAPPPPTGRIYQAYLRTAAKAGVGRIYQASLTASLAPGIVPSGIQVRRGGNLGAVTARVHRGGSL